MKPILWLAWLLLATASQASGAESTGAILRCDPGTLIKKIDGSGRGYYNASHGQSFRECAIPLSAGPHTLDVCYDLGSMTWLVEYVSVCSEDRVVTVDAQPGHTYRLKLDFAGDWKAWIEDVTESEAGLSYDPPPRKPRPAGSKKDRETILVIRATPEYVALGLQTGMILGKYFRTGQFGALKHLNFSRKGSPGGYHLFRAHAGDTVAFTSAQLLNTPVTVWKLAMPCNDFPMRVFEDLPAGKVLYLGHLGFREARGGYVVEFIDDFAEAREYIDAHHPELAGRLEPAPFREARTATFCRGGGADIYQMP